MLRPNGTTVTYLELTANTRVQVIPLDQLGQYTFSVDYRVTLSLVAEILGTNPALNCFTLSVVTFKLVP